MAQVKHCLNCGPELSRQNINGRNYTACPSENRDYVFWDNPVPVAAAIIEHQENIILARNKKWPPRMYGLITEFLEDAMLREVRAEMTWKACH